MDARRHAMMLAVVGVGGGGSTDTELTVGTDSESVHEGRKEGRERKTQDTPKEEEEGEALQWGKASEEVGRGGGGGGGRVGREWVECVVEGGGGGTAVGGKDEQTQQPPP